ncbi:MAG: hypothetical protein WDO18_10810 [Acidobacteriota bacterium]
MTVPVADCLQGLPAVTGTYDRGDGQAGREVRDVDILYVTGGGSELPIVARHAAGRVRAAR